MDLFYFRSDTGNLGDDLNGWLWPQLLGTLLARPKVGLLIAIGSILDSRIPKDAKLKVVFGAGIRRLRDVPVLDDTWDIRFVRGPISAKALQIPAAKAITDSAIALGLLKWPQEEKRFDASFIPHYKTATEFDCGAIARKAGLHFIDPREAVEKVISEIRARRRVIAEAMHGAIVADTFRVPWLRVNVHRFLSEFGDVVFLKWLDWGLSLHVDVTPAATCALPLREGSRMDRLAYSILRVTRANALAADLERVARSDQFCLSEDCLFKQALTRVGDEVEKLNAQ